MRRDANIAGCNSHLHVTYRIHNFNPSAASFITHGWVQDVRIDRHEARLSEASRQGACSMWTALWLALTLLLVTTGPALAWVQLPEQDNGYRDDMDGVHVVDGSYVMNVGELQVNITNHGLIGSQYSVLSMMSADTISSSV